MPQFIRRMLAATWLLSLSLGAAGLPAADRVAIRAALDTITGEELQRHVDVLADDTFEGRQSGTRGGHAAGVYLTTFLKEHNLDAAGERGSYFQPFGRGYRNILGLLPGSDPELAREVILVGAHYDHVGYGSNNNSYGPTGYIHNGADDNASGVAGVLELIDACAQLAERPRRTILFAFWDGEEQGLLGSQYWVSDPTVELNRVKFAVNCDMIGRLREQKLEVYGTRTGVGLREVLSRANAESDLTLDYTWEMKANSDHHTFFTQRIPVVMFHTGLHDDYHRPSDDAHKVNSAGMRSVSQFMFEFVLELAERQDSLPFRAASFRESPEERAAVEQPIGPPAPRLGISWKQEAADAPLVLTEIGPDSAADRAGLRVGDKLVSLNGEPATNPLRLRYLAVTAREPLRFEVERTGEKPVTIEVPLDGRPSRVGISWRIDDAAPSAFFLTQVVLGSPADAAGLRVGDRIYDINGRTAQSTEEFLARFQEPQTEFELTVERQGRLRRVRLEVEPL